MNNAHSLSGRRLALFVSSLDQGGAQRTILNMARGFADNGLHVDLLLATGGLTLLTELPAKVHLFNLKAHRALASLPALVLYLRKYRPEIMISTQKYINVIAIWAKLLSRTPTKLLVREGSRISTKAFSENPGIVANHLVPALARRFYRSANGIVAASRGLAEETARWLGVSADLIPVIYNPAITPEVLSKARGIVPHPWFHQGAPPVILGAGRLARAKDFGTLIRAFARLREHYNARLVILGEGSCRPQLEKIVRDLHLNNEVSLPGFARNPYAYMAKAALFALSSAREGSPSALVEALALGTPVVATDCQSGPREILADGKYGNLVPVGDYDALASSMLDTLSRKSKVLPSREHMRQFSLEVSVNRYLQILQSL